MIAAGPSGDERLKQEVKEYWNAHPCGTQFTHLEWGSKNFFDEVERFRYETQPFMRDLMEFEKFRGKNLLEVGCGLGTDLIQFARGGAHVTGVYLTPRSIELVKRRFELEELPVDARVADAEQLPFDDDSFDVVYSFGVLHHTPDTQKAINEVHRVLKPGGKIIIMLYHKNSIHVFLGAPLFSMLGRWKRREHSVIDDWIRIYDGAENPLGKAYSKSDARRMFSQFHDLRFTICDSIRRKLPRAVNAFNQALFARWFGFWMVMKGYK